jgi:hypothetical protein
VSVHTYGNLVGRDGTVEGLRELSMAGWMKYEEVVRLILDRYREELGLDRLEPKQKVPGDSGTQWEIDVVAYAKADGKLILFECRQYKSKIKQEAVGGFAFRIDDTQAAKGTSLRYWVLRRAQRS